MVTGWKPRASAALERPALSPAEFMAAEVAKNGGHEDLPMRRLRELLDERARG